MAKAKAKLPVMIRYEGPGQAKRSDWHVRDLVAIFPTEIGTNDWRTMACYSTVGQHSTCDSGYAGSRTKKATPKQVKAMLKELRKVGYHNLKVVSRPSSHHARARRGAAR